ncbi:MAG: Peptidase [Acidimicrobiales bacterium]|jgi:S1-C subfamily serine protease|nr:Peptidase [Acidimicrobiales bacterium]
MVRQPGSGRDPGKKARRYPDRMPFDDGDEGPVFREPPPADDRLWRHPSELGPVAIADRRGPWAVAVVSGLIGAALAVGLVAVAWGTNTRTIRTVERLGVPAPAQTVSAAGPSPVDIAQKARPAITQVIVRGRNGNAIASGVIFRTDGHVMTNSHVVLGAESVHVVLADGKQIAAKVIGTDLDTDLAVLKIDGDHYPVAVLGSAAQLKVGQYAMTIGDPLGLAGGPSATAGIISALHRHISAKDDGRPLLDMIQTDAPISTGSSGGALLDSSGLVVGITTAIGVSDAGADGLGFATPIDVARSVADEIIARGHVVHAWIGLDGQDMDTTIDPALDVDGGAVVGRVVDGGPAAKAGLHVTDVIIAVDGKTVMGIGELVIDLRGHKPGDVVTLSVVRGHERKLMRVTLAERPRELAA